MRWSRVVLLILAVTGVFAGSVLVLVRFWPGAPSRTDYLVIGTIATFSSLIVLFAALVFFVMRIPDLFHKRRKPGAGTTP